MAPAWCLGPSNAWRARRVALKGVKHPSGMERVTLKGSAPVPLSPHLPISTSCNTRKTCKFGISPADIVMTVMAKLALNPLCMMYETSLPLIFLHYFFYVPIFFFSICSFSYVHFFLYQLFFYVHTF